MVGTARLENMTRTAIDTELDKLLKKHGVNDAAWVLSLDEFDEPPLFERSEDVAFLGGLPRDERGAILLRWSVSVLDRIRDFLAAQGEAKRFFLSLTFLDWDLFGDDAQAIPTPSILVSPDADRELGRGLHLISPVCSEALQVAAWLGELNRDDLCVAEGLTRGEDEPLRVYLGYKSGSGFRSVGDYLD
jgi:hypothetical protein